MSVDLTEQGAVPAQQAKLDPETLVLRGRPAPAIRFRRGLIVSLATMAAAGVVGTAWYALEPRALHLAKPEDDTALSAKPPSDTLGALPNSYANVPKLGPPLPGDLGRPILERQRQLEAGTSPVAPSSGDQARAHLRRQRLADLKAARESGLLVQSARAPAVPQLAEVAAPPDRAAATDKLGIDMERDPNAQQRKADFVRTAEEAGDTNPFSLMASPSPFTLSAGSVIPASLITGLRSDLPGLVTAQVTERVFDSATGQILLIPQGARLVGHYDSVVAFGQRRALVVWQRILFPDGSSVRLDNAPASDPSGYAGLADQVDFHTSTLLKGVAVSTLLGVGAELQFGKDSDLATALRQSTQQSASQAGSQITARNLQIQPTITIRPGAAVRLVVHRDLVLRPWKEMD